MEIFRYERKYLITERMATAIRDFVACYLVHDEHMAGQGLEGYRVCSLYLDTPHLALYKQSLHGIKNRYKLRIRYYDEYASSPAFLEIKKRTTETVHKLRAVVPKPVAARLLHGGQIAHNELWTNDDASHRALEEFNRCCDRLSAIGMAFVNYRREAFVSQLAESVRVTFDRNIVGHEYYTACGLATPEERSPPITKGVLLELKYNGRAPRWMHDLVTAHSLSRMPFSKYVLCVDALKIDLDYVGKLVRS